MSDAGSALAAALAADIDRLLAAEPEVRADAPDSVHQMRVATRRLRSVLKSYRTLLHKDPAAELGAELRWLAGLLGAARDAEVRAERFTALLAADRETSADHRAAVAARLVDGERERYASAHAAVLDVLDGERYRALRRTLERWRAQPPLRPARAARPAAEFFGVVLERDSERLEAQIRGEPSVPAADRLEALHDIRKSAKRLRYCAEAAERVLGEAAATQRERAKHLQTVLGDHRDAVESEHALLDAAAAAERAGEDTTVYRNLAATEAAAAQRCLARYPHAAQVFTRAD
ncbi:CHAD domain-containing protein [Nocardia farcinica]|uniref:CHAD domain-containing protein n=1 Tax=Nocardia farcinica (strain IFM 10152) TaxID=247156 RepID=Q5YZ98_NOCFA|nr:CHAD domain-containing protein [Nocardia farcinica]MBF6143532.1 CHAD domain-containing protein [Nocardia farcinica]MBF6254229.1 CHAD domain-containing protein [Nocardia farcinica]MBF6385851.1 CHAD domain-containing protein [Nocardia farcinica]MBF6536776.1 CHAD domain-containing protein [Nocardia farcinica]PFW99166.1 hypothetical protein CJ469_05588 [Nocardia farcinica]